MHAFFTPFGSMPNNAIVGASAPIAVGAALFKRLNRRPGIVIANLGDAALGCGPVWEAMNFAAMGQFRQLWREHDGGNPPVLFNVIDNFYGMGSQTSGETMGYDLALRVAFGVNPEAMHAERVDGYNPLAVADAVLRKRDLLLDGRGPVLLDTVTYRLSGHSPLDASTYRTREEIELWEDCDCIRSFADLLVGDGLLTDGEIDDMRERIREQLTSTLRLAASPECARVDATFVESVMFSATPADRLSMDEPELEQPLAENPRVRAISQKVRGIVDGQGQVVPKSRTMQFRDAIFEAIVHRFSVDPTLVAWGEENRDWGGAFGVYRGLSELLPYRRLFNSPISEAAIVGAAVGYAMSGGRALVELMYCDFLGRCGDEVFNQMAKWQSMSAGLLRMPVVLRVSVGDKYGAQHSQDWAGLVGHIPGLKAYYPATPTDAKGMLNRALRGSDPVVFFESQVLYDMPERFEVGGVPEGYYETPEGEPVIRREGDELTIATLGPTLYRALAAADILEQKHGVSAEVVDLRFVAPLNYEVLVSSVRKTGRLVLASDAVERGSFLHTVASHLQTLAFDYLDAPVVVVGARNHIAPSPELGELFYPQPETIVSAVHARILPLPGHEGAPDQADAELLRRAKLGV
jgi:2-oxoisovalerate dehydrogenase E1 component